MNNKAQIGIGGFVMIFVTIIVGLALFLVIAQTVGTSTTTVLNTNQSVLSASIPAVGTELDLKGQNLISVTSVVNQSATADVITANNYTISEYVSDSTGLLTVYFTPTTIHISGANLTASGSTGLNITYVYGPDGYISDSGSRGMAAIIPLFFALLIAIIAMTPVIQSKIMDAMG